MTPPRHLSAVIGANSLAAEAAAALAEALDQTQSLHLPGVRERHRRKLERAIELASQVIDSAADDERGFESIALARLTLVTAHAARAQDARHGASQLSQSAQRAPTSGDCEDGWRKVEEIVANCEASAAEAAQLAAVLDDAAASKAAQEASSAAREARRIIDERNHAYTFHTDPGFSFGEGWYLAAAAVLVGVTIQIEPDKPQTTQAERFLRDAGLGPSLVPYRSRPRANKALPEIVARAFRADPLLAQAKLRAAFLGDSPIPETIVDWTARTLAGAFQRKRVLIWVRCAAHHPTRNSKATELLELCRVAIARELEPVLIGDALDGAQIPAGARDMTLFWKLPIFQEADMRRAQLQLFETMKCAHGLVGQLGVTTAGMDGPALMGLPTMYLTDAPNVRLGKWVGAVPGYEEIVRDGRHLEQIDGTLRNWARRVTI